MSLCQKQTMTEAHFTPLLDGRKNLQYHYSALNSLSLCGSLSGKSQLCIFYGPGPSRQPLCRATLNFEILTLRNSVSSIPALKFLSCGPLSRQSLHLFFYVLILCGASSDIENSLFFGTIQTFKYLRSVGANE